MKVIKNCILFFLVAVSAVSYAQEVEFKAELSKETLGLNERLRMDFIINKAGDNFKRPEFKNFRVKAGPLQQVSQVYRNGQETFKLSYGYILVPKSKGKFTIGSAEIEVDGKIYKTPQKEVKVTASVDKDDPNSNAYEDEVMDQIHLVAEVSKRNPYLNEGLAVNFKLYIPFDLNVSNPRVIDMPKFNNFWSQVIDIDRLRIQQGKYNGQAYQFVTLRRVVLYPQASGKLKIEPFTISLKVRIPTNRRNRFGQPIYETTDKNLASNTRTINVKTLPIAGKPANFTGAVGDFDFGVSTTKNKLNASESLEAEVKISGKGNLKLLNIPKLTVPSSLEMYEPEHSESVNTNLAGMRGSVTDSYTIVPSYKGKYTIPKISFSYFDPNSETYKTLSSNPLKIDVENGPQSGQVATTVPATDSSQVATTSRKRSVDGGQQFRFIKLNGNLQPIDQERFFKSPAFWVLLLIPLIAFPIGFFVKRRRERTVDVKGKRSKRAGKLVKKYLSDAKKNLGQQQEFYNALERSLYNYIKAKFLIQTGEMSKERTAELLAERDVDQSKIDQFTELLKSCEFARYTPSSDVQMKEDYNSAAELISKIDKQLK
jgi:hypothetical protein